MKRKKKIKKESNFSFDIDIVKGVCPHCDQFTALVSIVKNYYRCSTCGEDTKQHVNGSIRYLPLNIKPYRDLKEHGEKE
jgi:uncharacterized protein (DUF983 family)